MKFKQIRTGTVLEVINKEVIEMMASSDAYVVVEQPKGDKPGKGGKGDKPAEGDKTADQ